MSDIKKILDTLSEMATVSGSVATVAQPLGGVRTRAKGTPSIYGEQVDESDEQQDEKDEPTTEDSANEVKTPSNFGLWQNSYHQAEEQKKRKSKKTKVAESRDENEMDKPEIQAAMKRMKAKYDQDPRTKDQEKFTRELAARLRSAEKRDTKKLDELGNSLMPGALRPLKLAEENLDEGDLIMNPFEIKRKRSRDIFSKSSNKDHEISMARSDLLQSAKNSQQIISMLKDMSDSDNLEGWVQEKITKATDYLNTVREYLEGVKKFGNSTESVEPEKKRLGPDKNDPWEQGWRANPATAYNPYERGTHEHEQWEDGQAERRAQPSHYDESVNESSAAADDVAGTLNSYGYYTKNARDYVHDETGDKFQREGSQWKHQSGTRGRGPEELSTFLSSKQEVEEGKTGPGLWANIRSKRERIKRGSGERMRKPGSKGAPSNNDLKSARTDEVKEDVTDYNPKSQGGTRKELLAKLRSAKTAQERSDLSTRARKAGATQKELQSVSESSEQYQGQYDSKDEAIAYATDKVKTFRDPEDGIEIWALPSGGFDVVHTMNSNGRQHVIKNGGKKLGTVGKRYRGVAESSDDIRSARVGDEIILKNSNYRGVIVKLGTDGEFSFKNESDGKRYRGNLVMIDRNLSQEGRYKEKSDVENKRFDDAIASDMERIHKSGALKKFGIGVAEATGDGQFDSMMKKVTRAPTAKERNSERIRQKSERQEDSRRRAADVFGTSPADKLGIRKSGVAEGSNYSDSMTDAEWEREYQREKSEKELARKEIEKNHVSQFKTKEEAIEYANNKLKTFKDSKIGISVYAMPDGGFDVASTARTAAGQKRSKLMSDAGGKHLGTLGPRYKHKMAEGQDISATVHDINMKMMKLLDKNKQTQDPKEKNQLKLEFQKLKTERNRLLNIDPKDTTTGALDEGSMYGDEEVSWEKGGRRAPTGAFRNPAVVKTDKSIGTRVSDIGPGGKEYNVKTDKEWDKQKGVAEEVDLGQYAARKSAPDNKDNSEIYKIHRERMKQYGDELEQRQKEKQKDVKEGISNSNQDPNLAKAYHMGVSAYKAYKNDPKRAQMAQDKIESEFPQYLKMWTTGYYDGERFDKQSVKKTDESLEKYVDGGVCPKCGGEMVSEELITEKQDACYHKVKSRYKIWPSAYASGALVKCRKAGAANWGNKSKK